MIPFEVLKEYKTIYVRNRSSNYELRFKIVLKQGVKEPALLITKVFAKNGKHIETTKLGRIPFSILPRLINIIEDSINFISKFIHYGQ